jgi:hypothetical protein
MKKAGLQAHRRVRKLLRRNIRKLSALIKQTKPMKRLITIIGLVLCVSVTNLQAQTNDFTSQVAAFFEQNPKALWELGAYAMLDTTGQQLPQNMGDIGGGIRLSYWINPSVGAALDANYIDGGLSYGVLSMTGRGTAHLGTFADLTFYAIGGPGYQLKGGNKSLIAMVGTGVDVRLAAVKFAKFFAEYQHRTTTPATDLVVVGLKKEF